MTTIEKMTKNRNRVDEDCEIYCNIETGLNENDEIDENYEKSLPLRK